MPLDKPRMLRDLIIWGSLVVICWVIAGLIAYHLVALFVALFSV